MDKILIITKFSDCHCKFISGFLGFKDIELLISILAGQLERFFLFFINLTFRQKIFMN